jgi:hypothetical protein
MICAQLRFPSATGLAGNRRARVLSSELGRRSTPRRRYSPRTGLGDNELGVDASEGRLTSGIG